MYKFRHYSTELGRWPPRDPIEENGGVNLYGFMGNDPLMKFDRFGLELSNIDEFLANNMVLQPSGKYPSYNGWITVKYRTNVRLIKLDTDICQVKLNGSMKFKLFYNVRLIGNPDFTSRAYYRPAHWVNGSRIRLSYSTTYHERRHGILYTRVWNELVKDVSPCTKKMCCKQAAKAQKIVNNMIESYKSYANYINSMHDYASYNGGKDRDKEHAKYLHFSDNVEKAVLAYNSTLSEITYQNTNESPEDISFN